MTEQEKFYKLLREIITIFLSTIGAIFVIFVVILIWSVI